MTSINSDSTLVPNTNRNCFGNCGVYPYQILYAAINFCNAANTLGGGASRKKFFIMKSWLAHKFEDIVSVDNLFEAWREFVRGKRAKPDVQQFSLYLMDNILSLNYDLISKIYRHGLYHKFRINDPKPRAIHKALVRDRLVHQAIYRILYPFYDRTFIADSYSCRKDKGTHKAFNRFREFFYKVSHNNTLTCWVLKCDVKQFFASIDHKILARILSQRISDKDILRLLREIISSFETKPGIGLPLGNLTSQLFVNIYMNEFDRFVKHKLKAKYYIRYADDFVILSTDKGWLERQTPKIRIFIKDRLRLNIHKISIKTVASGVDFLGWVHFSNHRTLRTSTKRRMLARIRGNPTLETLASYLGLLSHGNTQKLKSKII